MAAPVIEACAANFCGHDIESVSWRISHDGERLLFFEMIVRVNENLSKRVSIHALDVEYEDIQR